ncbi:hypothetical protein CDAR_274701 [Caerostris darwini]|uniref:Uncharacterized protein n=1 Tax=Caerostris darwini TaxID=1538125 RepID=A0AAV4QJG4_9ARAC|nr:hypothetical protein CDAR_274701 [Caerostris darwini]
MEQRCFIRLEANSHLRHVPRKLCCQITEANENDNARRFYVGRAEGHSAAGKSYKDSFENEFRKKRKDILELSGLASTQM